MLGRASNLALMLFVAGCAAGAGDTKVVNLSRQPLRVEYAEGMHGPERVMEIPPGETRSLPGANKMSDLGGLEFREAMKGYVFANWPTARDRSSCISHCQIIWRGQGRLAITL